MCRQKTLASLIFPEFQRADSNSCPSEKGEDTEQERSLEARQYSLGGRVLVLPQGINITISWHLYGTKSLLTNGKCQTSSFQRRPPEARLKKPKMLHLTHTTSPRTRHSPSHSKRAIFFSLGLFFSTVTGAAKLFLDDLF